MESPRRVVVLWGYGDPGPRAQVEHAHRGAVADDRLDMLLNHRISDQECEPLLDFLEVAGVGSDNLADCRVQTLLDELDQQCYGTRDEWVAHYETVVSATTPPRRWYRSSIILRCIAKFFGQ